MGLKIGRTLFTGKVDQTYDTLKVSEAGAILIGFWYVFFYTDYHILDELCELCPLMQTIIPHENHVDGVFLTHTRSSEINNFGIIFTLSEQPLHSGLF